MGNYMTQFPRLTKDPEGTTRLQNHIKPTFLCISFSPTPFVARLQLKVFEVRHLSGQELATFSLKIHRRHEVP